MGFIKDSSKILGGCIGLIIVIILVIMAVSFILNIDLDPTIQNNTTIELNGITITVPQTDNYKRNESTTFNYYDFDTGGEYGKLTLNEIDNFNRPGTTHEYDDYTNQVFVRVINKTDLPYIDRFDDKKTGGTLEGSESSYQYKKTIDDKVIILKVYDGANINTSYNQNNLAQKIIDSARKT